MIAINALNKYLLNLRKQLNIETSGNFVILKKKDRALSVGPLKKFTLEVWYIRSKKEKYNVLNLTLNKTSLNDNTDNIIWESIEEELLLLIYSKLGSDDINKFINNSFSSIELKKLI